MSEVQRYLTIERLDSAGPEGVWHYHHIFPDETFDADRGALRDALEDAQADCDAAKATEIAKQQAILEARIASIGNLAFLAPGTKQTIGNRPPIDYLKEIAGTPDGRKPLEAQLIPMEPGLWKHTAFDDFRKKRCELITAKAKEIFFGA